jgi:hypothetical protein
MLAWKPFALVYSLDGFLRLGTSMCEPTQSLSSEIASLGFVLTGQGAQWPRRSHELLGWPIFKSSLVRPQQFLAADHVHLQLEKAFEHDANHVCQSGVSLACLNSPFNTTISRPVALIDAFITYLAPQNILTRKLKVDVGYRFSSDGARRGQRCPLP